MSKLKVDELRSADRSVSDTANITLADNGSTTIPNGTLSAGTIGDNVTYSNKFWTSGDLNGSVAITANQSNHIYFNGSTSPYFVADSGVPDTTNSTTAGSNNFYQGDATNKLKVAKKGIYLITFDASFYVDGTGSERIVEAYIQDGSTNNLARSSDQVSNTTGTADYGGCSTSVVKLVNSGDQFIFTIYCLDNGATIHQKTRINFVLLKAIA